MANLRHSIHNLALDVRRLMNLFTRLDREAVAAHYLKGTGLEIGALHNPLKVPSAARVRYVDRMPVAELRRQYPELASYNLVEADVIDNGEKLSTVGECTQDFVIANHFIEHCENPIDTLMNLVRVLKKDGILFMCVPDKRYTFDGERPVTPFEHLVRDFKRGRHGPVRGISRSGFVSLSTLRTKQKLRPGSNIWSTHDTVSTTMSGANEK